MPPYETMTSSDEPIECPLCMEILEVDDMSFFPCTCGYQICRFCWHRLKTDGNSLCPACRKPYSDNPAHFEPLSEDEIIRIKKERRQKDMTKKQKLTENRRHLSDVRVVQKNLVFVVGLSQRLADTEVLKKNEYFGKFGKIVKVVINPSPSYAGSQTPSASAYVTYSKADEALRAIQTVNNIQVDSRTLKASLGTTKYCSHFLKGTQCPKLDCMYLHDLGEEAASFTKEEMSSGKHLEYESKLIETILHIPRPNQNVTANNDSANNNSSNSGNSGNSSNFGNQTTATNGFGNASSSTPPPSTSQSTTPAPDNTSSQTYPSATATATNTNGHDSNVKLRPSKNGKSSAANSQNRASRNYSEHNSQQHAQNHSTANNDTSQASGASSNNSATAKSSSSSSSSHSGSGAHASVVVKEKPTESLSNGNDNTHHHHHQTEKRSSTSSSQQQTTTHINENTTSSQSEQTTSHETGGHFNVQSQDPTTRQNNLGNLNETGIVNSSAPSGSTNGFDEGVDQNGSHLASSSNHNQNFYQEDLDFDPFRESTKALQDLMQIERNSGTSSREATATVTADQALKNGPSAGAAAGAYGSSLPLELQQQMNLMSMASGNGNSNFYNSNNNNNFPLNTLNTNLINSLLSSNKNAAALAAAAAQQQQQQQQQQLMNPLNLLNRHNILNNNLNLLLLENLKRQQQLQQLQQANSGANTTSTSNVNTATNSLGQQQQQQQMAAMAAAMSNGKGLNESPFPYPGAIDPSLLFSSASATASANPLNTLLLQQQYQQELMLKAAAAQAAAVAAHNKQAVPNGVNGPDFFNQLNATNGPAGNFFNNNNASKDSIVPPPGFSLAKSINATSPLSSSNDSASSSSSATSSVNNSKSTTPALNNNNAASSSSAMLNGTDPNSQARHNLSSNDNLNSANKFNMLPGASNAAGPSSQQQQNLNNLSSFLKNDAFSNLSIDPSKLNFFNRSQPFSEPNGLNMMNPMGMGGLNMDHGSAAAAANQNASNHFMNDGHNAAKSLKDTFRSIFPNANISFSSPGVGTASGIASMNLQQLQEISRLNSMSKPQDAATAAAALASGKPSSSGGNSSSSNNSWPDDPAIVALNDTSSAQFKSLASLASSPQPQHSFKQQTPQSMANFYSANNFFGAYNNNNNLLESNESLAAAQNSQQAKQQQQQQLLLQQQQQLQQQQKFFNAFNNASAQASNNGPLQNSSKINPNASNISSNLNILNQYQQLFQQQQQQQQQKQQLESNNNSAATSLLQQFLLSQQLAAAADWQQSALGAMSMSSSNGQQQQIGSSLLGGGGGGNPAGSMPQGVNAGSNGSGGFDSK